MNKYRVKMSAILLIITMFITSVDLSTALAYNNGSCENYKTDTTVSEPANGTSEPSSDVTGTVPEDKPALTDPAAGDPAGAAGNGDVSLMTINYGGVATGEMKIITTVWGAPSSLTGANLGTVDTNQTVWIVEKAKLSGAPSTYYYVGYVNSSGQSLRGYVAVTLLLHRPVT